MKEIGPIDYEEVKVVTFPFVDELKGNTIATAAPVTVKVVQGEDPDPSLMVVGSLVISDTDVKQLIKGNMPGDRYVLRGKVTDNLGQVHVIKLACSIEK